MFAGLPDPRTFRSLGETLLQNFVTNFLSTVSTFSLILLNMYLRHNRVNLIVEKKLILRLKERKKKIYPSSNSSFDRDQLKRES